MSAAKQHATNIVRTLRERGHRAYLVGGCVRDLLLGREPADYDVATDATPHGDEFPQQVFNDKLYEIYYRFLETEDEYFDYAPAKIPPQGRWRIYGIHLPDTILRKVYHDNAARLLRI